MVHQLSIVRWGSNLVYFQTLNFQTSIQIRGYQPMVRKIFPGGLPSRRTLLIVWFFDPKYSARLIRKRLKPPELVICDSPQQQLELVKLTKS